jgi:hypothetical protein
MYSVNSLHNHGSPSHWIDKAEPVEVNSLLIRSRFYVGRRKQQHRVYLKVILVLETTVPLYTIKKWVLNLSNMIVKILLIARRSSQPGIFINLFYHPAE